MRVLTNPWILPFISPIPPHVLSYANLLVREFEVRPEGFANRNRPWIRHITGRDILLCAGMAMAPSTSPDDISAWGFLVEHRNSLRPVAGKLRVVDDVQKWDSRIKGLFAERIGLGLAAWLLWHDFDVVHIADAGPFISNYILNPQNAYHRTGLTLLNGHGQLKPDFFCLTAQNEAVIAESKGAIGSPSSISKEKRDKAKNQVNNVIPVGVKLRAQENRLAFATNLRATSDSIKSSKTDTGVHVEDPEGNEEILEIEVSADMIVVHSYCKFLQFLGLGFQTLLLRHDVRPMKWEDEFVEKVKDESVLFLNTFAGMRFGLLKSVAETLFLKSISGVSKRVKSVLSESRLVSSGKEDSSTKLFVLPNGIIGVIE